MKRVGNDIVDLTELQNRTKIRDTRFIDRVFTPYEREKILNSSNPGDILWALWTGKETGYKIISKLHASVTSAPKRYEVCLKISSDSTAQSGLVDTPYGPIELRFFINNDYIHCIGATEHLNSSKLIIWDIQKIQYNDNITHDESQMIRELAKKRISSYIKIAPETIDIIRPKGAHGLKPPVVLIKGKEAMIDLSLSHDGSFLAFTAFIHPMYLTW